MLRAVAELLSALAATIVLHSIGVPWYPQKASFVRGVSPFLNLLILDRPASLNVLGNRGEVRASVRLSRVSQDLGTGAMGVQYYYPVHSLALSGHFLTIGDLRGIRCLLYPRGIKDTSVASLRRLFV